MSNHGGLNGFTYIDGLSPTTSEAIVDDATLFSRLSDVTRTASPPETKSQSPQPTTTLIIDGIDYILATDPTATPFKLAQHLLSLQAQVDHLCVTVSADHPLLHQSNTILEQNHQTLATLLAHQADVVVQLRGLDSGAAKDVSGVLRISAGGQADAGAAADDVDLGREYLYLVQDIANVRIWSRGD